MGKREYFVGDQIKADGDYYTILGKITYRNKADGKTWDEYRLKSVQFSNEERWLSVDEFYNEYSISRVDPTAVSLTGVMGYHLVDSGIEQVIATSGDVGDVVVGDTARFEEYEDNEEEKIVSVEDWDDGTEYSRGYYLDSWEFGKDGENHTMQRVKGNFGNIITGILVCIIIGFGLLAEYAPSIFAGNKKIEKYVKNSIKYEYVTSITGNEKQKANAIYDIDTYAETYWRDLEEAKAGVIVSSPRLNTQKVNRMIDVLRSRQELGVKVTVVTWHPDAYKYGRDDVRMELLERLRKAGFEIRLVEDSCEHYAVIDHEIVWYGSVNLLSKEDADDNLMRVCSKEIAAELLEMTFGR